VNPGVYVLAGGLANRKSRIDPTPNSTR
jgi:hypothetical protein